MSWPSGWGVKEAVDTLIAESKKYPASSASSQGARMLVFVRLDAGNPEDAIISYMGRAQIPVFFIQQINEIANIKELATIPWYFVSRGDQHGGLDKYLTKVAIFKKPLDSEYVGVYRINP
jgi:hypothetical protein